MGPKHGVGEPMKNPADVILVPSRLTGKVESIDCHVVTRMYTYVCSDILCSRILLHRISSLPFLYDRLSLISLLHRTYNNFCLNFFFNNAVFPR